MAYFDAAAGAPLHPAARQALLAAQEVPESTGVASDTAGAREVNGPGAVGSNAGAKLPLTAHEEASGS